jgi:hypothetical protein
MSPLQGPHQELYIISVHAVPRQVQRLQGLVGSQSIGQSGHENFAAGKFLVTEIQMS